MVMISHQTDTKIERILVVEDDASSFIAAILRLSGYDVTHLRSGTVALTQILEDPPTLITPRLYRFSIPPRHSANISEKLHKFLIFQFS
ncbi:MAG: hypothetical protein HC810_05790 [Acaryochloridaceae cyanobacterium RL_2_7]|nr:hypothetical protein [Acaryochloridaceae cyanobacterium RL_2_7]